jgi:hypothetical protein
MTPEQAASRLDRFAADLHGAVERGLGEALQVARLRAIWWSSGPHQTAYLRTLYRPSGHGPYSIAVPHPPGDEARINIQERRAIVNGWLIDPPTRQGGKVSGSVYNTAPEAAFMGHWEGEEFVQGPHSRMMARPLPVRVLAEAERGSWVLERLQAAIESVMR